MTLCVHFCFLVGARQPLACETMYLSKQCIVNSRGGMGLYLDEGNPIPGNTSTFSSLPSQDDVHTNTHTWIRFVLKQYIQELNRLKAALRLSCPLCSQYGIHTYIIHKYDLNIRIGLPQNPQQETEMQKNKQSFPMAQDVGRDENLCLLALYL